HRDSQADIRCASTQVRGIDQVGGAFARGLKLADETVASSRRAPVPITILEAPDDREVTRNHRRVVIGSLTCHVNVARAIDGDGQADVVGTSAQVSGIVQFGAPGSEFSDENVGEYTHAVRVAVRVSAASRLKGACSH